MSSFLFLKTFTPLRLATSASPVASIIILPIIASLPALDSVITPFISSPSKIGAQKARCSIGLTPAFKTRLSATTLNPSLSSS